MDPAKITAIYFKMAVIWSNYNIAKFLCKWREWC